MGSPSVFRNCFKGALRVSESNPVCAEVDGHVTIAKSRRDIAYRGELESLDDAGIYGI